MEILSVSEKNWEELKTVRLASLRESPEAFSASYEVASGLSEAQWKSRASGKEGCSYYIAKNESSLIGIIGGSYKTGEYELISLWVSPSQRENGIAKMLVYKIVQHAKNLKRSHIFLEVLSSNFTACKLYEQCGFSLVSTRRSTENGTVRILNKFQLNLNA